MGNDHQGPRPRVQEGFQLLQSINVQVVGRFVEQQHIGFGHQHAGKLQASALTTGKVTDGRALAFRGKTQSLRQLGGAEFLLSELYVGGDGFHGVEKPHGGV